jgi:hypothetical protein
MASEIFYLNAIRCSNATRAEQIEARCSIEYAAELEAKFRQTYLQLSIMPNFLPRSRTMKPQRRSLRM